LLSKEISLLSPFILGTSFKLDLALKAYKLDTSQKKIL
jgi:hypothetical protein